MVFVDHHQRDARSGCTFHPATPPCRRTSRRALRAVVFAAWSAFAYPALCQVQQSLEMQAGTGGPAGNGPSIAGQAVTFQRNTDNPAGNTFVTRTPPITVTYSLSAQQYTGLTAAQGFPAGSGGNAMVFGSNANVAGTAMLGSPLYAPQNTYGVPSNVMFTSSGDATAGTGIAVAANGAVGFFLSARALALQPAGTRPATNARVRMADLTLTFNRAVDNPIVHFAGLGAFVGTMIPLGFSAEFDLQTPGLGLTRLSGNAVFAVAGSSVNNAAINPASSCSAADDAACGSVRVNGAGITTLTFRVFLRGDGGFPLWEGDTGAGQHPGDVFVVGVSLNPIAELAIAKTNTPVAGNGDQTGDTVLSGTTTTYQLTVTNNGADPAVGTVVRDTPGAGIACPAGNAVSIVLNGVPQTASTVSALTGTGIALGALAAGQTATLAFQCTVN